MAAGLVVVAALGTEMCPCGVHLELIQHGILAVF